MTALFDSVWMGLKEMERVCVLQTSEAPTVSTVPPLTNTEPTVTEVSLTRFTR